MKSFLKWAGSKRSLLRRLCELLPARFDRYVEPFAGSARLYFELEPNTALLGDVNRELIQTFRQIRQRPTAIARLLGAWERSEAEYYRIRAQDKGSLTLTERAARFIYLNRLCFNGIYRVNRRGEFNVPFGGEKGGKSPPIELLRQCSHLLRSATLVAGGFEKTLDQVRCGDFVYLDPPYRIAARRVFNEYSHSSFSSEDLAQLRLRLEMLDRDGVPFLLSYGYSREALALARGFRTRHLVVKRQIAGFANNRRRSRELVVTNF